MKTNVEKLIFDYFNDYKPYAAYGNTDYARPLKTSEKSQNINEKQGRKEIGNSEN